MAKKHHFSSSWRYVEFEEGFGPQLKRLNKNWIIKKHNYWTQD